MARVAVIAATLVRITWRDVRSLGSITENNFFFFLLLVLYQQVESGLFLVVLLGLPLLLLLSGDTLAKIPPERLALWPLTRAQNVALRFVSVGLNPLLWIAAVAWLHSRQAAWLVLFLSLLAASQGVAAAIKQLRAKRAQRAVWTVIPTGSHWLAALVAKNLRQLLSTLDPYPLLPLALGTFVYRFAARPNLSALSVMSVLLAIGLSTFARACLALTGRLARTATG